MYIYFAILTHLRLLLLMCVLITQFGTLQNVKFIQTKNQKEFKLKITIQYTSYLKLLAKEQFYSQLIDRKLASFSKKTPKNCKKILDLFRLRPPPSNLCAPQLQSTCHYIVNLYVKILYVRLGDANNIRPLSWGAQKGKDPKFKKKSLALIRVVH